MGSEHRLLISTAPECDALEVLQAAIKEARAAGALAPFVTAGNGPDRSEDGEGLLVGGLAEDSSVAE